MPVIYKSTSYADTPRDAVRIPRIDASEHVFDSICDLGVLKSLPYRGGFAALAMFSGVTSIFTVGRIRKFFKVGRYGFITTTIPAVYIPMMGAYIGVKTLIAPPILLQEKICPTCLQVKSMALQLGTGILYPFACSFIITYQLASNLGTYQAPPLKLITQSPVRKEMFDIFKKATSKVATPLVTLSILHCALACGILSLQMYMIDDTLQAVEQRRKDTIDEIMKKEMEKNYRSQKNTILNGNNI